MGSVGRILPNQSIKVMSQDGSPVATGSEGEYVNFASCCHDIDYLPHGIMVLILSTDSGSKDPIYSRAITIIQRRQRIV
jgi:hypothetical protein